MKYVITFLFIIFMLLRSSIAQNSTEQYLSDGDKLFDTFDNPGALEAYLKAFELDSNNYEAAWKVSRAYVDIGETLQGDKRAEYYKNSEFYARKATKIDSQGSKGHLYLSIALGRVALDAGAKARIKLSKEIKKEVDLAIKYDPNDDIAHHVLGRWNRKLANLSWIEKGFANIFLGGVPKEASDENAVKSFQRAIELKPNHIHHHLELGITYEMMDLEDKAREEYQKCLDLPKGASKDDRYKQEAKEFLENL
jgi:tetratricopeptide (TPR) repeat protein